MGYYNSFVIRIWSDERGRMHGKIEHVASHESLIFLDPEGIVEFICTHLDPPPTYVPDPAEEWPDDDGNPIDEPSTE